MKERRMLRRGGAALLALFLCVLLSGCVLLPFLSAPGQPTESVSVATEAVIAGQTEPDDSAGGHPAEKTAAQTSAPPEDGRFPSFSGEPYAAVADNMPAFTEADYVTDSYERYSALDTLERCGVAMACIGKDLMPEGSRDSISQVRPTGWHSVQYEIVEGGYLYNRCHLIGYQLTGESANEKNLITGTRYLNTEGMLPFENMVADYVKETGNHVLYRATPIFVGNNLVASGVQLEGYSVEDGGDGICFNVYAYNVQPGIEIDYATGESRLSGSPAATDLPAATTAPGKTETPEKTPAGGQTPEKTETPAEQTGEKNPERTYILNTGTKKFHYPDCSSVDAMKEENKLEYTGTRDEVIAMGYTPCGRCHP